MILRGHAIGTKPLASQFIHQTASLITTRNIDQEKMKAMEPEKQSLPAVLEDLWSMIGGFGRYPVLLMTFMCYLTIVVDFQQFIPTYYGSPPNYQCVPKNPNVSSSCRINQCGCVNCTYVFMTDEFSSAVSEWNLICDRAHLKAMTQAVYMTGLLVGSVGFGKISDHFGRKIATFLSLFLLLLGEQFQCLETMTPFGFMEFRDYISPASGFQSAQFRLLENKLGVCRARMRSDSQECCEALRKGKDQTDYMKSEKSPSLLEVVEKWLCRTPGLEVDGFNFWGKFKASVYRWLESLKIEALAEKNEFAKADMLKNVKTTTDTFESIFDEERHNQFVTRGERRFSHKALQGAMMIYFYRDQPRFHQPYQILQLLIDIDSLIIKWRYNHLMLVQRTIGTKSGTGGSPGYQYLRSTISDRYKVFIDLFHLSNFLVPREYIPPLTRDMKTVLRQVNNQCESDSAHYSDSENEELSLMGLSIDSQNNYVSSSKEKKCVAEDAAVGGSK